MSRSTYLAASAAQQRLPVGVFAFFFVLQFGVAAAELKRRRVKASHALADVRPVAETASGWDTIDSRGLTLAWASLLTPEPDCLSGTLSRSRE